MSQPLLTKDAINIGGHKLPLPVVGAVVGILGLVLVLRARSQGAPVASVGAAPTVTAPAIDTSAQNSQDIANLSNQLASLQNSITATSSTPAATTTTPDPNLVAIPSFSQWLSGAYTGQRPDLAAAIAQGRTSDLQSEYAKEVASSEASQLAAGRHF